MPRHIPECMNIKHMFSKQYSYIYVCIIFINKQDSKPQEKTIKLYILEAWKINMEPTNHPFRKEHDLPNLSDYVPR